eukprot:3898037-Pyramimonas_sp.AAC.1
MAPPPGDNDSDVTCVEWSLPKILLGRPVRLERGIDPTNPLRTWEAVWPTAARVKEKRFDGWQVVHPAIG